MLAIFLVLMLVFLIGYIWILRPLMNSLQPYGQYFVGAADVTSTVSVIAAVYHHLVYYNSYNNQYCKNRKLLSDRRNLTEYNDKTKFLLKDMKTYKVFKKCDSSVNIFFWIEKSVWSEYFYTETDNETATIGAIMKCTSLRLIERTVIDLYFELCLGSYLTNETINALDKLQRLGECHIDEKGNILLRTQKYYESSNRDDKEKTPDYVLISGDHTVVIDAYNGAKEESIKKKLRTYNNSPRFPSAEVYVFASCVSTLPELSVSKKGNAVNKFALYTLNSDGSLQTVDEIHLKNSSFKISIKDINDTYFHQYSTFYAEVHYWLRCDKEQKIARTNESNKQVMG